MGRTFKRLSGLFSPGVVGLESAGRAVRNVPLPAAPAVAATDHSEGAARFFEFHIARDLDGRWRWTLVTVNGHALARSFHAYDQYFECEEAIRRFQLVDRRTPIVCE